ncbi:hypothetical protein DVH05_013706 [Phytophthora capsici]|nr:hypothetical protein DVH05_013706 [Phytophthora capsici]
MTTLKTTDDIRVAIDALELDAVASYFDNDDDEIDPYVVCEGVSIAAFNEYVGDGEGLRIPLRFLALDDGRLVIVELPTSVHESTAASFEKMFNRASGNDLEVASRRSISVFTSIAALVAFMSCDTHKYGYGSKGTSVVLYKNSEIRRFQYFSYADWTGGLYATPTLAGSRPGALSATAWASMVRLGREGYLEKTKGILDTVDEIKVGIQRIDGIHLLGDPKAMVVSFAGDKGVNALKVSDAMAKHGWSLSPLQHPTSVHLCVTVRHIGKAKKFLNALEEAVQEVKKDPNPSPEGGSAIYGMASSLPAGPVDDLLRIYTDITLKV